VVDVFMCKVVVVCWVEGVDVLFIGGEFVVVIDVCWWEVYWVWYFVIFFVVIFVVL